MDDIQPIPPGYHSITPYLAFKNTDAAIKFYEKAFGAKEIMRLNGPEGRIVHAEIEIESSRLMMADESAMIGNKSAESLGGSPVGFMVYVPNVDAAFERAVSAGATVKRPVVDQFYGDRSGTLSDPFGIVWTLGIHIENVSSAEAKERMKKLSAPATAS